jgi:hypothetical protein
MQLTGPRCYLDAPIYHLDLLAPLDERRAKTHRYEAAVPGRRLVGAPLNAAFYLPEIRQGVRTAPVPEPDRTTIASILDGPLWPDPRPVLRPVRSATLMEIDAHWHGAPASEELYEASLDLVEPDLAPMLAGEEYAVDVRVDNLGTHTWPWGLVGQPEIRVSYHWLDPEGGVVVSDGVRTPMPESVPPGASCRFPVDVIAPATPGSHVLVLDLLHEDVRWFGREARASVEVIRRRRIGVVGASEELAGAGAASVTELLPWVEPVVLTSEPNAVRARIGYATDQGPRDYVLAADQPASRGRLALLRRTAALVRDAGRLRRGRDPHRVGQAGRAFLDALARCDALLVSGAKTLLGDAGARESLQQVAAVRAAAALRLPVAIAGVPSGRTRRKGLGLLALRAALVVVNADPGNERTAIDEAVRRLGILLGERVEP